MIRTRFGHGKPWRGMDAMFTMEDDMTEPSATTKVSTKVLSRPSNTNLDEKWMRVRFPKVVSQKCRICRDSNINLSSYISTSCRICASKETIGELGLGTIGNDGSLLGKWWRLSMRTQINDMLVDYQVTSIARRETQAYSIELQRNGNFIRDITFPNENILCSWW